jgi:two-component system, NtrC family, response regulator AtoC
MVLSKLSIAIVDDEDTIRLSLSRLFSAKGYETYCAANGAEAIDIAEQHAPDVFLLDLVLPDIDGIEVLRRIKSRSSDAAVVLISAHGNVESAVRAMKEGAENFVTKPVDIRRIEALVDTLGRYVHAGREVAYYRRVQSASRPFIGVSPHAQQLLQLINLLAANADTTVLVSGESGTGKGVVAALIHERSRRSDRPFVEVSCAELTASLLESDLFGHERGAFTDAKQLKKGLVEVADGGTLFLDEAGELDLALQPKLLKVLESRTFRRLGGVRDISADVRIIAATNVDLEARVKEGRFRIDLYYRLKVMPVRLLPLRERTEDIQVLAEHFIAQGNRKVGRRVHGVTEEALDYLRAYSWPGNIRELRNVLERAMILSRGELISATDLPPELLGRARPARVGQLRSLEDMERELIGDTLTQCGGNRTRAAHSLDISRSTLLEKMRRYGLS